MSLPCSVRRLGGPFLLLLACLLWTGCEDGTLNAPDIQGRAEGDSTLFESYVALGNSITAGFQSGGIDSTTQAQSYAAILADSMNTPFGIPALRAPGCPPPLTQFFPTPQRPDNTTAATCGLREAATQRVNNVAVPGATVLDALSNTRPGSSPNALTQFILGGRTQVEAALDANPTFATLWIGNNDVLGPALAGTDNATSFVSFASDYTALLDQLTSSSSFEGGVLIGVVNVTFVPFFSPGPVYAALDQAGQFPPNFNVASSCEVRSDAGLTPLVPLNYGLGLLAQAQQSSQTVTLDCAASGSPVLTLSEAETIVQRVRRYNNFLRQQAQQRGLAFFNPNTVLGALYAADAGTPNVPIDDPIPKFPAATRDRPFGPFFSLDGVHPSALTHRVVAARLVQTINETYGTSLSPPSNLPSLPVGGPPS
ncbi:MAG: SGNH/GDSL hydrolase family protein [Salinibacter sp.]